MHNKFIRTFVLLGLKLSFFPRIKPDNGNIETASNGVVLEKSASFLTQGGKGRSFEAWGSLTFKNDGE